jgi:hypothetical protein
MNMKFSFFFFRETFHLSDNSFSPARIKVDNEVSFFLCSITAVDDSNSCW